MIAPEEVKIWALNLTNKPIDPIILSELTLNGKIEFELIESLKYPYETKSYNIIVLLYDNIRVLKLFASENKYNNDIDELEGGCWIYAIDTIGFGRVMCIEGMDLYVPLPGYIEDVLREGLESNDCTLEDLWDSHICEPGYWKFPDIIQERFLQDSSPFEYYSVPAASNRIIEVTSDSSLGISTPGSSILLSTGEVIKLNSKLLLLS